MSKKLAVFRTHKKRGWPTKVYYFFFSYCWKVERRWETGSRGHKRPGVGGSPEPRMQDAALCETLGIAAKRWRTAACARLQLSSPTQSDLEFLYFSGKKIRRIPFYRSQKPAPVVSARVSESASSAAIKAESLNPDLLQPHHPSPTHSEESIVIPEGSCVQKKKRDVKRSICPPEMYLMYFFRLFSGANRCLSDGVPACREGDLTTLPVSLQLALEDPVHSVSLQQFVYEKLKAQQALMGDQRFAVLMESVDREIVRQLQDFLQGFWCLVLVVVVVVVVGYDLKRVLPVMLHCPSSTTHTPSSSSDSPPRCLFLFILLNKLSVGWNVDSSSPWSLTLNPWPLTPYSNHAIYALSILRPSLPHPPLPGLCFCTSWWNQCGLFKNVPSHFPNPSPTPTINIVQNQKSFHWIPPLSSLTVVSTCKRRKRERTVEKLHGLSCGYDWEKNKILVSSAGARAVASDYFLLKKKHRDCSRSIRGRTVLKGPKEVFTESILKREYM